MGKLYDGIVDKLIYDARKNKNVDGLRAYQNVKKALQEQATAKNAKPLTDDLEVRIVSKYLKELKEDVKTYEGKRQDLADSANGEIPFVEALLPKEATEEEVRKVVEEWLTTCPSFTNKEMGKCIAHVRSSFENVDGKMVSDVVKSYL